MMISLKAFQSLQAESILLKFNISTSLTRTVIFKFSILKIVFVISRKTSQIEKIDQLNKLNVVSYIINLISSQVQFFNLDKKIFASSISQDSWFIKHEFSSIISKDVLNEIFQKNIAERILRRILLSSTMKLFKIVRFKTNKRLLNAFNNAIPFILDIDDYTASICICVEVLNILRYKINNIQSILNELMLIITELKDVHERDENRIYLRHWRKMIFLTSAILKSLSLFFFSKIIMSQKIWTFSTMIQENNKFFDEEIIKNYINMIIERLVNTFNEFVKKIKRIDMTIFNINVYWNVTSNTSVASSSIFKSFMLISDFATFRSFEKFNVNICMRSQSAEWFKQIA